MKYYVIEHNYVGPNPDQNIDADTIEIATEAAKTNCSQEPRTDGWLGTTNDWSKYAHGEYDTLEAARSAVTRKFGETRQVDSDWWEDAWCGSDESVVEIYKAGALEPLDAAGSWEWVELEVDQTVTVDSSNAELEKLADEITEHAKNDGFQLCGDLYDRIIDHRDNMIIQAN